MIGRALFTFATAAVRTAQTATILMTAAVSFKRIVRVTLAMAQGVVVGVEVQVQAQAQVQAMSAAVAVVVSAAAVGAEGGVVVAAGAVETMKVEAANQTCSNCPNLPLHCSKR